MKETLEEAAENFWLNDDTMSDNDRVCYVKGFTNGAKYQQERSYSEEDMKQAFCNGGNLNYSVLTSTEFGTKILNKWFKQFKKK